jgi:hypothetical protein
VKYVCLGYHDPPRGTVGSAATTLRFDNGKVFVTAGAAVPGNDRLGNVTIIEAADLNHAITLMSRSSDMNDGACIEIRPLNDAEEK